MRPEIVAFKTRPVYKTIMGNVIPTATWRATAGETPAIPRRGNKFGQASAVRVSMTNHSLNDGIYAADFAGCPKKWPRPRTQDTA
jgi:hypothetical protein